MASLGNFDASQIDPTNHFDPIPAGKYIAAITWSARKPTKSGAGYYHQLTLQILEGEYKNRLVSAFINLENQNAQAVEIARKELASICWAVGVLRPKDTEEFHHIALEINVGLKKRDDTGELGNVIRGYAKKGGNTGADGASGTTASKAFWKRT